MLHSGSQNRHHIYSELLEMTKVLVVTEYYNESKNISELVENMVCQTHLPNLWLIIDDGSSDNSTQIFEEKLKQFRIPYLLYSMPLKTRPNQNLKGRAFRKIDILNNDWVRTSDFDYLVLTGADTRFPPTYIELSIKILETFSEIGVMAGGSRGEAIALTPMGGGKIVRWNIIEAASGLYWDLDPDSLWNIIALKMGYRTLILRDLLIWVTRPTHMTKPSGLHEYGARMYYLGWNPLFAIFYSLILFLRRKYPSHFLKGYVKEYKRGTWHCKNPILREFYSAKRMVLRSLGFIPSRDEAIILESGIDKENEVMLHPEFQKQVLARIREALDSAR